MARHELVVNGSERYGADDVKLLKAEARAHIARGNQVRIVEVATGKALIPVKRGAVLRWVAVGG